MKNQKTKVYAVVLFVCFLFLGAAFAVAQLQSGKEINVETSENLSAKNVRVTEISKIPHLRFSVTTPQSDTTVTKLKTRVIGYDKEGNVIAGSTRILCTDVFKDSKLDSLLAINPDLKFAERYLVQITSVQSSQSKEYFQKASFLQTTCESGFCTQCSQDARTSCGTGKVSRVTCDQANCTCDYTCKTAPILP